MSEELVKRHLVQVVDNALVDMAAEVDRLTRERDELIEREKLAWIRCSETHPCAPRLRLTRELDELRARCERAEEERDAAASTSDRAVRAGAQYLRERDEARRAAIEECARVAEEKDSDQEYYTGEHIAKWIRALTAAQQEKG